MDPVVDSVAGDDQSKIRDEQDDGVVGIGVADLDDGQVVSLEGEAVTGDHHRGDRRWRDQPRVHLVPQQRTRDNLPCICVVVPAEATARGPNRSASAGGEPMSAVTVGDEDVRQVPALAGNPVPSARA